eukprot:CAMPEP_0194393108 /NCGR_PEP_ID=MMETSP0174-20130528/123112_1 /TAXON_ID=216777 /ORGANISM="Proboscia alata, Strain PI-D3" /LENGTH=480 /DNA_ID=CAMNT_0039188751 /DNA_START=886 /DNA_END=2328 /DNA_ORIENTATION=-
MSILMFLFIYVFTTARDTKDTLIVSSAGAEAIPFLKLYGVMPCATLFIVGYSKLSDAVGKHTLFCTTVLSFFAFYVLFAFVLFPLRDTLHFLPAPGVTSSPAQLLLRYWSYSLYFIVSELYASAGVPLLFWQCANDVTSLSKAKRFYPLFAVTGNLAPIVSGKIMGWVVSRQKSQDDVGFGQTLRTLALIKVGICVGILGIYRLVYRTGGNTDDETADNQTVAFKKPKKKKVPLSQSIAELSKSKELRSMAIMVLCYNVCIELTEVLWKGLLRKTYTSKSSYMGFMAGFSQTVGVIAFVMQLGVTQIIEKLGWKRTALIPPIAMGLLALPFFGAVMLLPKDGSSTTGRWGMTIATALTIGTAQNVISKVSKYSLFDPCKEMAYIPLGPEAKVKGKAAVDVLGARLGRSLGSASQQAMVLVAGGTILRCAPALGVLYLASIVFWIDSVGVLGKLFTAEDKKREVCDWVQDKSETVCVTESK